MRPDLIRLPEENIGRILLTSITAIPCGSVYYSNGNKNKIKQTRPY